MRKRFVMLWALVQFDAQSFVTIVCFDQPPCAGRYQHESVTPYPCDMRSTTKDDMTLGMHQHPPAMASALGRKFACTVCKHTMSAALLQVPSLLDNDDALPHDMKPGVTHASLTLQLYVRYTGAESLTDVVILLSGPDGVQLDQVHVSTQYHSACCCF